MGSIRAAAFTILLFAVFSCLAQERVQEDATPAVNFHRWGSVTVFNGLPSDTVRAITQTSDGILWFGTDNGLARFDGRTNRKISLGSPPSDRVQALAALGTDLWIATQSGAFVYNRGNLIPIVGTESLSVTAMSIKDRIFLATSNGMVFEVKTQNALPVATSQPGPQLKGSDGSPLSISSLAQPTSVELDVGTKGDGVWALKGDRLERLGISGLPLFINALAWGESKTGEAQSLWIGADAKKGESGLYELSEGHPARRIPLSSAKINAVLSEGNNVWAGADRYGLTRYQHASDAVAESGNAEDLTFANTSGGLRSDTVYSIFSDREGVVWIGTNRGVSRYDPDGVFQEPISDIPNRNFVRTVQGFVHGGWFAGTNRGLFERDGTSWDRVPGFEEKVIHSIGQNDAGLLVGTSTGVFDRHGRQIADGDTRSIENFGDTYAAVMGRGVVDISSEGQDVIFPDETACSLLSGRDRLWIGTAGHGLFSFDGTSVKLEASPDLLKSGTIWALALDSDASTWIAGEHGVFRLKGGEVERVIDAEDVRDVLVDSQSEIWAATTTRGLMHARHDDRFGWIVTSIGFEQGLPSEKAFSIFPEVGLMVATNRGLVHYQPGKIAPKLLIDRVLSQRMHSAEELNSSIALDYPQNSLLIEVAGLSSRTFPEEFQYAFSLKNGKGEEIERRLSSDAQFSPHDLKPGDYSVEAIAFNRDLLASDPVTVRFSVAKAPFPRTATALGILLVIALGGLVWAIFEHRRIRQRNRELAAARFDLANEAERERSRIARDLHDQTLADLRKLMMKSDKGQLGPGEVREEIESVSTEIRRICEDLSPSVLENVGLVPALEFLLANSADEQTFQSDEDIDDRIDLPINAQLQIYRVAQEVLANIRRHSDADSVKMTVSAADGRFQMDIRDNGRPFQPSVRASGRGIANIRSRASLIGGRANWRESSRGGNVFTFSLPLLGSDKED